MPEDLAGKIAVVTGGGKGIGRAVALGLARRGADVVPVARTTSQVEAVAAEIRSLGRRSLAASVDVRDPAQVDALMRTVAGFGGVDIFVNNAAITRLKRVLETTDEEIDELVETNLKGALRCLRGAASLMREQGRGGSIIVVTSINALAPLPSQAVYSATKAALEALVRCLAADLAQYRVRVNSVAPGAINTDMNAHLTAAMRASLGERIPLGRVGEPEDMVGLLGFLASEEAAYVTGATFVADGGFLLRK